MHFPTFVAGKPGDNPLHDNTVCRHHEREAETFQPTNDSFHVHAKNARIENKWAEILGELSMEQWDVVLFSETRCAAGMLSLNGGHILYTTDEPSFSSGVAILHHQRHVHHVKQVQQLSLRVMYIDLLCGTGLFRIVVGYAPHAGYPKVDLDFFYDQLRVCLEEAWQMGHTIIVGGDFNTQVGVGIRGLLLDELAHSFDLVVANSDGDGEQHWTFESSMGVRRRIPPPLTLEYLGGVRQEISEKYFT